MPERAAVPVGRGAYIVRLDLAQSHLAGVADKIRAQIAALETLPAKVDLLYPSGCGVMRNLERIANFGSGRWGKRLAYYLFFYPTVAARRDALDFIYVRYQGSSPLFHWMLWRLRRRNPGLAVFVELPTYPYETEAVTLRERFMGLTDRASRGWLARHVDRIVTFSRADRIFGVATVPTDNGVDVAALQVLTPPAGTGLRMLGMANLSFWHGYDRVVDGLRYYYAAGGEMDISFDIVGVGTEFDSLQARVREAGLQGRVRFWGARRGSELDSIMADCHVGISSIGMHRLNVDTSNLKSREFCARGLPFAIAYDDRDFPGELPFVFHAPANDEPLDIAALAAFYDRLRSSHPDYPAQMRSYAERRLTWRAKMQPVIATLRQLQPDRCGLPA